MAASHSTSGYADIIRAALKATDEPLTLQDIIEGAAVDVWRDGMRTILGQRVAAGELLREAEPGGTVQYRLNPDFQGKGKSREDAPPQEPAPRPRPVPIAPEPHVSLGAPLMPAATDGPAMAVEKPAESPAVAPRPVATGTYPRAPANAAERLVAIGQDLEDLLDDVIGQPISASALHQVVKANVAVLKAMRALHH